MTLRLSLLSALCLLLLSSPLPAQRIALEGLRSAHGQGAFHGLRPDAAGNLYTLFDAHDGVHLLKLDAAATTVLAFADFGSASETGVALDLDPAGNIYVTGTSSAPGGLTGTSGTAFPARADSTTNSFVAKLSPSLQMQWISFCGSGRTVVSAIVANGAQVVVTGTIFSGTLPVTASGVQQRPASNTAGNGFVESFTGSGALGFATYLTGEGGDTTPSALALGPDGSLFVAGTTTATGFPTVNALVPRLVSENGDAVSGFLARLTPGGDAFVFSTFVPGGGLTSLAVDAFTSTVAVSGSLAAGLFPLTVVPVPFAATLPYQAVARLSADGSAVLSATRLSPGTQSVVAVLPGGTTWAAVTSPDRPMPALPPTLSLPRVGDAALYRIQPDGRIDRSFRLGGRVANNSGLSSLPTSISGLAATATTATIAGAATPTFSSDLLSTQRFDLPLVQAPNPALPSTVRDALPTTGCSGSLCTGSAGLLASIGADDPAPSISVSTDALPEILLRNTGSTAIEMLSAGVTGFSFGDGCGTELVADGECSLSLAGSGPGELVVSARELSTSLALPATALNPDSALVVAPSEIHFGIQTANSAPSLAELTVTNLSGTAQVFQSQLGTLASQNYSLIEDASDCAVAPSGALGAKTLAPSAVCHLTLAFSASGKTTVDGPVFTEWQIGARQVGISAYTQAAAITLSATRIDFGLQFSGGLTSARALFLANAGTQPQSHSIVSAAPGSFRVIDGCPTLLQARSVCRIDITYEAATATSIDELLLSVDGVPVLLAGETLPQPAAVAASVNPALQISAPLVSFSNAVPATSLSSEVQTVSLTNTGKLAFPLSLTLTGDFTEITDCPASLPGGSSCLVLFHFAPTQPGERGGLLAVSADAALPAYVTLSGTGTAILSTSGGVVDFGSVAVGTPLTQWTKISQPFPHLTATSASAAFSLLLVEDTGFGHGSPPASAFSSTAAGSCFNCYLGLQFLPEIAGAQAGSVLLSSDVLANPQTLTLTGTAVAVNGLVLTPTTAGFGTVPVGSTSSPVLLMLTNASAADLTIATPVITGQFAVSNISSGADPCSGTLVRNATCLLPVQFQPSAEGAQSGTLTLPTSAGSMTAALTGFGSPSPGIAFAPVELSFRNVPGQGSTQQIISVSNTGTQTENIGVPAIADEHFNVNSQCGTLAPGSACTIQVTYEPSNAEAQSQLILPVTMGSGAELVSSSFALPVSGVYTIENAGLQIVPGQTDALAFGRGAVGRAGAARTLRVNNLSAHTLSLQVEAARQFPLLGSTCGSLAAGASCQLSLSFLPLLNGDATGTVSVTGQPDDGSGAVTALGYLQGYGVGGGTLSISGLPVAGALDFGELPSGQSATRTLTLTNSSPSGDLTVRRVQSGLPFAAITDCGAALGPNQSCHIEITYTPLYQTAVGTAPGAVQTDTGSISIESDAENAALFVDLTGRANPVSAASAATVPPFAAITTSAGAISFADTGVGTSSPPQSINVLNTGTALVNITGVLAPPGFAATTTCTTLLPSASCAISVTFSPQSKGFVAGGLEIRSDSATPLEYVSLSGSAGTSTVSLQPQSLDLGPVLVGTSTFGSAILSNNGTDAVTLGNLLASGDFSVSVSSSIANACPAANATLAAGAACAIQIAFRPTQAGSRTGTLSVATSATAQPITVALSGAGLTPQLSVTPAALRFGTVAVGSVNALSFTLSNGSGKAVMNLSLTLNDPNFRAGAGCGAGTLAPGSSCAITVVFQPSAAGLRQGTIAVTSSDPASPLNIALSGEGVVPGNITAPPVSAGGVLLTVNGGISASAATRSGIPATFALAVSATGGFTGAVNLTCTPSTPASYTFCSLLPSTLALSSGPQNSIATVSTIAAVAGSAPPSRRGGKLLCLLLPGTLLLGLRRRRLCLAACLLALVPMLDGCGGGDSSVRYAAPGSYHFTVTASGNGIVSQSVGIDLSVTSR